MKESEDEEGQRAQDGGWKDPTERMLAGPNREEAYQGGLAMASCFDTSTTAGRQDALTASPAKVFQVAAPRNDEAEFSPRSLHSGRPVAKVEMSGNLRNDSLPKSSEACKKDCAPELLQGSDLVGCGQFLFQRLLEVIPLCSQLTGSGTSKSIFPLPTSRSRLLEFDGSLCDSELCWLLCVCLSLNSFWGGEVFSESFLNDAQKSCLT